MKIRIGSRESALAVAQARMVMDAIQRYNAKIELELVTMKTSGDMRGDARLAELPEGESGKGLFVKELDEALLDSRVDITVHSLKDMPMALCERIPLIAVSTRGDARDALVLPQGAKALPPSPIGCSSARRRMQLQSLFPDAQVQPVRGNVPTRLAKLDGGEYGALVLAAAGLERLGLCHRASRILTPEEMLPAAGQGIIAVQARRGFDAACLSLFHDAGSMAAALAERSFVRALGGGCSAPMAAYAETHAGTLRLRGWFALEDGTARKGELSGAPHEAELLGQRLAAQMKAGERI